jgi:hypothetical protein
MKKLLIVALLPLLFYACAKEDDTNPGFREPSCEDTTDDGLFEKYTLSEEVQFLKDYKVIPEVESDTIIRYKYISSRELFNRSIIYDPIFVYKLKRPAQLFIYMPLKTQQEQYYSWSRRSTDTSMIDTINLYNARLQALQPGCYRLYYIFSDTDTGTVYTKGHYDIQIKN